jgi:uncharacterized protein YwbE/predicted HTH transcriptional regulator
MMDEGKYLKNVKRGIKVEIRTKIGKMVNGVVEDLGSRKEYDGEGIQVMLKTGEIGRVRNIFPDKIISEIDELLKKGESNRIEFKSESLWSLNKTEEEIKQSKSLDLHTFRHKASKVIIARAITALLNTQGGNLIIGIRERKDSSNHFELIGIEEDLNKLKELGKDASKDGYKRMIIDDIIRPYFPSKIYNQLGHYIKIEFEEHDSKILCNIRINKSPIRIFLNLEGKKVFMIRTETESRQIVDEELVDYCMSRFSN